MTASKIKLSTNLASYIALSELFSLIANFKSIFTQVNPKSSYKIQCIFESRSQKAHLQSRKYNQDCRWMMNAYKWVRTSIFMPHPGNCVLCGPLSADYCNVLCLPSSAIPTRSLVICLPVVMTGAERGAMHPAGWKAAPTSDCQYAAIRCAGLGSCVKEAPLITSATQLETSNGPQQQPRRCSSSINCFICIRPLVGENAVLISVIYITMQNLLEKLDLAWF